MASHLVLARPGTALPDGDPVIIADRFSWSAFCFGGFWFLFHGLWIESALALAGTGLAIWAVQYENFGSAGVVLYLCLATLIGLEAADRRLKSLQRKGCRLVDIVEAPDRESAFELYVAGWDGMAGSPQREIPVVPVKKPSGQARVAGPSIGLVPWQGD